MIIGIYIAYIIIWITTAIISYRFFAKYEKVYPEIMHQIENHEYYDDMPQHFRLVNSFIEENRSIKNGQ